MKTDEKFFSARIGVSLYRICRNHGKGDTRNKKTRLFFDKKSMKDIFKSTAVPYIFEIVIFVLLFELALIVFLNYPFPVFPFR